MTTGTAAAHGRAPEGARPDEPRDAPEEAQAAAVRLTAVSVRVPRRADPVLSDVSLAVAPGEHVLVLGPSGSGKSTLLQVVTGVVPHSVTADLTGDVRLGTSTASTVVERSRHLGVVAQDPGSAVCLPVVEQDLALPLENHGTDPAQIGPRIDSALETVGAAHLRHRAAATLSGGESQRVALAAALVTRPQVLLLDEPTSMLDPAGIASVRSALTTAAERYGPAVVVVEHRLDEWAGAQGVAGLPPRAVALADDGRVVADGPTATVLRQHGPSLVAAGCWLPLEAELEALTGAAGGLSASASTDLLRGWADDAPHPAPATGAPVLAARGLTVGRRPRGGVPRPLLHGLDLEVRPGEVVALLGANGTGKSTTLLTLAGLLPALEGRVDGPAPGMLFQDAEHQFLAHTVADEIGHGLPDDVREQVVAERLDRHRLSHLAGQNPFRLSGGEKRRTGLAAMLAHDRPCLLADEPTLGLDRRDTVATARAVRAEAQRGRAVVLTSHDLRTVASIADRVVLLGEGRVLADGPTGTVLADRTVVRRAGLTLPPVVAWLVREVPHALGHVLRRLDEAVA